MSTISLCMIVRDGEQTLEHCLSSVQGLPDEIIIVDTGSTDRTREIAGTYTRHVYAYEWKDDFAAARNYCFGLAGGQYIMWLDADDYLPVEEWHKWEKLKQSLDGGTAGVIMPYCLAADDAGRELVVGRRLRIVRRELQCRWIGRIHEYLEFPQQEVTVSDMMICHSRGPHSADMDKTLHSKDTGKPPHSADTGKPPRSARNLRILRKWIAEEPGVTGRRLFFYANECYDRRNYRAAARGYEKLLCEPSGFREDRLVSCARLAHCHRQLGDARSMLNSLLASFHYGAPQPDYCCLIGEWFEERGDWRTAVYWFNQALAARGQDTGLRPVAPAALTWLPHVRLALCHIRLGELLPAWRHNEQALRYLPGDAGLLGNKAKLEEALKKRDEAVPLKTLPSET
ncbi:MAG: glycosyl transferase [Paenibacillaceae bacterium]|jgi:tetratricopeptide (TPR) repeat protein|nr:glycosyl transferase [Paenibacillaceae bacterium]